MNAAPTTAPMEAPVQTETAGAPLPIIAVTMGDGAGIGPEVIVPALLHADTVRRCRPVVIGDAERLRQAARILGVACEIVSVETPADAVFGPGRINVIDLGLLPADLPWGGCPPSPATPRTSTYGSPPNSPCAATYRASAPHRSTRRPSTRAAISTPDTPNSSPISPGSRRCR